MARRKSGWRTYKNAQRESERMLQELAHVEIQAQNAWNEMDYVAVASHCLTLNELAKAYDKHCIHVDAVKAAYKAADAEALKRLG
jgi:hypothetical protein